MQQEYDSLTSQITSIRVQLSTMTPGTTAYNDLETQWNALSLQQSELVSANPSCF